MKLLLQGRNVIMDHYDPQKSFLPLAMKGCFQKIMKNKLKYAALDVVRNNWQEPNLYSNFH